MSTSLTAHTVHSQCEFDKPSPSGSNTISSRGRFFCNSSRLSKKLFEAPTAYESTKLTQIAFRRIAPSTGKEIICVGNFSPIVREGHRLGLPHKGTYKQILNTDDEKYCGGGFGVVKSIKAEKVPAHGFDFSAGNYTAAVGDDVV